MGAGRTTTGTVIGGLLAMYGFGHPAAAPPAGGLSGGGGFAAGNTAAAGGAAAAAAAGGAPALPPAPIATRPGGQRPVGAGGAAAAAGDAGALVAGLNEEQSRDILREEIAGDSPRCSGTACAFCLPTN